MSDLNLDRMVRSATSGWAGEPYCELIVDCLWQTTGWNNFSLEAIEAFWVGAAKSDLTVREFIDAKREELTQNIK